MFDNLKDIKASLVDKYITRDARRDFEKSLNNEDLEKMIIMQANEHQEDWEELHGAYQDNQGNWIV